MLRLHHRGRGSPCRVAGMESTVEKAWAGCQRREWNSGPFGVIERCQASHSLSELLDLLDLGKKGVYSSNTRRPFYIPG